MSTIVSYSGGSTPRTISAELGFRIKYLSGASVGCLALMTTFGLLLYFLVDWQEVVNSYAFSSNDPVITGVVRSITRTNTKVNGSRIYKIKFTYTVGGKSYSGTCYGSEYHEDGGNGEILEGDPVKVQYTAKNPALGVVLGKDRQEMPFFVAIIFAVCFLFGMLGLGSAIKTGFKNVALITNGILTSGKCIRKEEVPRRAGSKGGKRTEYLLAFEFTAKDGRKHETVVRTSDTSRLLDESEERLVYDEVNPAAALLIDSLPKVVRKFFDQLQ